MYEVTDKYVLEPSFDSSNGLSLLEGLAVGALIHGGVCLMGTDHDLIQRAVVLSLAVMGALGNGAFDALIGMAIHTQFLLCFGVAYSMPLKTKFIHCNLSMVVLSCYGRKIKECRPYGNDFPLYFGSGLRQFGA